MSSKRFFLPENDYKETEEFPFGQGWEKCVFDPNEISSILDFRKKNMFVCLFIIVFSCKSMAESLISMQIYIYNAYIYMREYNYSGFNFLIKNASLPNYSTPKLVQKDPRVRPKVEFSIKLMPCRNSSGLGFFL